MPNRVLFTLALLLAATGVSAQPDGKNKLGGGASAGMNLHSLQLNVYRNSALCGVFESGSGWRPNFHLLYKRVASQDEMWLLVPRLHFNNLGAMLVTPALDQARARDPIDSSLVQTNREHQLSANLVQTGLDLFGAYRPMKNFSILGGPSIGMLIDKSWTQQEVITTPARARFDETGTNARTLADGDIPEASALQFSFSLASPVRSV